MNAVLPPKETEFVRHCPENFILVENENDGTVLVRAALDNLSERQKGAFIREMAAEGFVPDRFQEFSDNDIAHSSVGVRWIIDHSWIRIYPAVRERATRAVLTMLVLAGLILVLLMGMAVIRAR